MRRIKAVFGIVSISLLPAGKAFASWILPLLLLLARPATVRAQLDYTTNNGAITITRGNVLDFYVNIPSSINGLPVTRIGDGAFAGCALQSVTIPDSVTNIGASAFSQCLSLTSVAIPGSVTSIGTSAFYECFRLLDAEIPDGVLNIGDYAFGNCYHLYDDTIADTVTNIGAGAFANCGLVRVTIPDSVTSIGDRAFAGCTNLEAITVTSGNSCYSSVVGVLFNKDRTTLIVCPGSITGSYVIPSSVNLIRDGAFAGCGLTAVTIPDSVTSIGDYAFAGTPLTAITLPNSVTNLGRLAFDTCTNLISVYFQGNAPSADSSVFANDNDATIYYLPGTTGWGPTFGGRPAILWKPQVQTGNTSFGVRTNQFGFTVNGTSNLLVVVEASTNLANPTWSRLATNTLTGGSAYFSDPQWRNYPGRFYRLTMP